MVENKSEGSAFLRRLRLGQEVVRYMPCAVSAHVHHGLPISSLHHPALQTEARTAAYPTLVLDDLPRSHAA